MLNFKQTLLATAVVSVLAACGGGGGSAGTPAGSGIGGSGTVVPTAQALLTLSVSDVSGVQTNTLSGNGVATATAKLTSLAGVPIAGEKITFTADETLVKLAPAATALTNASGIATVQLIPTSLTSAGAGTVSASATVSGTLITSNSNIQVAAVNLTLGSLNVGTGPLPAFGNRPISVTANANGQPLTSAPVQVTFTASCGKIEPAVVGTNAGGLASTTYSADDARCAGSNVTITASAPGAPAISSTIQVSPTVATNIQFVNATPSLIYLTGSGGATQSLVTFKVVDASGNPLQNQSLQLSLVNAGPGVSLSVVGNAAPVTVTTNATGIASVPVFSGTVPTSAQVRAVSAGNPALNVTSNVLTIASGRPVQRAMSVAIEKLSIEGANVDGASSQVTVSLADRQGNPVPDGTEVNLVAQTGVLIPARCVVDKGTSQCSVQIRSQGTRTGNGRVQILAYVPGEEDFVDANFNNVFDPGESFTDLGNAYRDDNENGAFDLGEFTVPRMGTANCDGGINGRPNTCDGQWGTVDVRRQATIVFATSEALFSNVAVVSGNAAVTFVLSDKNGNSMPVGTTVAAEFVGGGTTTSSCSVKKVTPSVIPNTLNASRAVINLDGCTGGTILLSATTPGGLTTSYPVTLMTIAPPPTTPTSPTAPASGANVGP